MSKTNRLLILSSFVVLLAIAVAFASTDTIKGEIDSYFATIDEAFKKLAKSSALQSTNLKTAERLFVRELKKHQSYFSIVRANSKGKIISEAVRMNDVVRSGTDVEKETWFKTVKKSMKDYYSVTKDQERGRYYLIWSKPILKGERFVGAVCVKIDLWDSFYEFSENVYYPFLVRLNNLSLFSHKWNADITFKEEQLTIPGIKNISIRFVPEKQMTESDTTAKTTNQSDTALSGNEKKSTKELSSTPPKSKPISPSALVLIIVIVAVIVAIAISLLIFRTRKNKLFNKIEEENDKW